MLRRPRSLDISGELSATSRMPVGGKSLSYVGFGTENWAGYGTENWAGFVQHAFGIMSMYGAVVPILTYKGPLFGRVEPLRSSLLE